jgi:hypothetical protein
MILVYRAPYIEMATTDALTRTYQGAPLVFRTLHPLLALLWPYVIQIIARKSRVFVVRWGKITGILINIL